MTHEDSRPDPLQLLKRLTSDARRRALFRAHLGYARGVGATSAMLDEARRRASRGTDVVVAAYRVHGDPEQTLQGLDVAGRPRRHAALDVDHVLARNPEVVCIDDLAAPAVDGRAAIEAVPRLLASGMTVLATLHLLSIRSAADAFAGVLGDRPPGFLLDDEMLSTLDEIELVDIPPGELLQRLRDQHVLPAGELALALQQELRITVLESLRAMAFRVVADQTDRQVLGYMRESSPEAPWGVRGRIVFCVPARAGLEDRIVRASQYAATQDASLVVASVRTRPLSDQQKEWIGAYASLTHRLGGEFVHLHGRSVAQALVAFIRQSMATEVVLGHRRRARWRPGDTTSEVIRALSGVDVHILRSEPVG